MFGYQLYKPLLLCMACLISGCSIDALVSAGGAASSSIIQVDNAGVVTNANQNSFLLQGSCKDISSVLVSVDSFSVNAPCVDSKWSIQLDLSATTGSSITISLAAVGSLHNDSVTIKLTKSLSCDFNGQTISDGQSVTAYQTNSVASGSCSSVAEIRSCTNGVLSGTAAYDSCSIAAENTALVTVEEFQDRVTEAAVTKSFTVKMSEAKTYPVKVDYFVSGDSVYMLDTNLSSAGSVTFAAGETSKTVSFQVLQNAVPQGERLVQFNLVGTDKPAAILGGHYQSRLFIMDDDGGSKINLEKVFVIGSQVTCGISNTGALYCAGGQFPGKPVLVDAGVQYLKLEDSYQGNGDNQAFCGLTIDMEIKCNDGSNANMTVASAGINFIDFDAEYGICGINDSNELKCQDNSNSFITVDSGVLYKRLIRSYYSVCGITMTNSIRCATINGYTVGSFSDTDAGVQYSDISTDGQGAFYGLTVAGEWKSICSYGYCSSPTILSPGTTFTSLFRQCAISSGGVAQCDSSGMVLTQNFQHIYTTGSGGNYSRACGVTTTKEAYCWNLSDWSDKWLGIDALPAGTAVDIQGLSNVVGASNVFGGTCAYLSDGSVKCLGLTSGGSYRSTPVVMPSYSGYSVKVINDYSYFMSTDGKLYGNGSGSYSQLDSATYISFANAVGYTRNVCGITDDYKIRCIKYDGTFEEAYPGVKIKEYTGSESKGCYLNDLGNLYCWDRYYNSLVVPTLVDATDTYTHISGDYFRGCGISATTSKMKCWDNNWNYSADPVVFTEQDSGTQYESVLAPQNGYWDNTVCGITTARAFKCGTRNGAYSVMDAGADYSKIVSASCGITTGGTYRCSTANKFGPVFLSWKKPVLINKWFTNL